MKQSLFTFLILTSISCLGQQWTDHPIDSILTVSIPENFEVTDTLGQEVITAQIDNGLILITSISNIGKSAVSIENEADLIKFYKEFQKGYTTSQNGRLLKEEVIEIRGLKFYKFSLKATMNAENQVRHCLAVFINNRTYAISFWELEAMTNEMTPVRERLFNSVKTSGLLTIKNQTVSNPEASSAYRIGYFLGSLIPIAAIILFVVVWQSRKAKKNSL